MSMLRVDAHHHLWRYTADEFGWIDDSMASIRRDFGAKELLSELSSAHVDAAIAVQARQSIAETEFLLEAAAQTPQIAGVVGWLPIAAPDFRLQLERYLSHASLKGLRHVVQGEADGFLDDAEFGRGIALMAETGLVYDLLLHAGQLEEAVRFVDRHPAQSFVLDHIAKPHIAAGEIEPWATSMHALAERPNVVCKISGMVTEADAAWTPEQLRPYFDTVLEAFTPARLMVGTDWPVVTARCSYSRWWTIIEAWIAPLSTTEHAAIAGDNARRIYHLDLKAKDTPA